MQELISEKNKTLVKNKDHIENLDSDYKALKANFKFIRTLNSEYLKIDIGIASQPLYSE